MLELKRTLSRAFSPTPHLEESSYASAGAHVLCLGLAQTPGLQATFSHTPSHFVGYLCDSPPVVEQWWAVPASRTCPPSPSSPTCLPSASQPVPGTPMKSKSHVCREDTGNKISVKSCL